MPHLESHYCGAEDAKKAPQGGTLDLWRFQLTFVTSAACGPF